MGCVHVVCEPINSCWGRLNLWIMIGMRSGLYPLSSAQSCLGPGFALAGCYNSDLQWYLHPPDELFSGSLTIVSPEAIGGALWSRHTDKIAEEFTDIDNTMAELPRISPADLAMTGVEGCAREMYKRKAEYFAA